MELALAVDIGGTKAEAALVDAAGTVTGGRRRMPTGRDLTPDRLRKALTELVRAVAGELPPGARLAGAGIGSAGPVDLEAGAISPLNLPGVAGFPVVAVVAEALPGVPVVLGLDGLCIALAEHWVGAGRGAASLLGMVVSTGVGGGLILDGRPVSGATGNAGHVGQIEVAGFTPEGVAGERATLEAVASGPNTVAWARSRGWTGATGEELATGYAASDPIAVAAVRRSAAAVGRAVASATALCDVERVVIGGGFARVAPDYLDLVRASRDDAATPAFLRRSEIVGTGLGADGPLVGAAALVHRTSAV